ncbi:MULTISPECIES: hypothetical protein [Pseudomonas syringae group]|uniref:Uncharacterized protein n=5 Tax=Pseudomonas syringae group TaxID=136849 RepID=A0AAD0E3Q1_9PSED|nr:MULTISPECIES: hypothetical protein [Pseudomonas syringae group]AVB21583.1 hypothetical protein BKM03_21995 [Pseudomonas avellanae]KWS65764.1 hypothetical protein AL055_23000 [Pseudomonas amygdali pv. morsprunorum]PHN35493.1 hypothetical protein AO261_08595 [Pseudomonas avellanae]POC82544.1 hypothetical protein BKM26_26490 [Pseudomonas avellanae]POD00042.1 hypothetical protein BKM20_26680 [Pseudomonas avellanae]
MPMTPYLVSEFAKPTITNLVRECFGYDFPDIFSKDQVDYVFAYLTCLDAKAVLLEFDYVDRDYLEDFSRYYVKRFGNDGHKCARLHFFSSQVTHQTITSILEKDVGSAQDIINLNRDYLGFMVIKPLPRTFIGKTCLKVMPNEFSEYKRKRRLAREYKVDLFGISLKIESIAFQEQDKVVAACATTAIWASMHALIWRDLRSIHSCSEITINAINHVEGSSNSFPSEQLSNKQILRSLDVEELRYHAKSTEKLQRAYFLQSVVAHINSALPLILTGEVFTPASQDELSQGSAQDTSSQPAFVLRGRHAICVVGYKVNEEEDVLYVHDDRLGPYARAKLVAMEGYALQGNRSAIKWALGLQRLKSCGGWGEPHELIVPDFSVVPCDKKARLPFPYIYETCEVIVKDLKKMAGDVSLKNLTYEISLREIASIRQEVLTHTPDMEATIGGELHKVSAQQLAEWQAEKTAFLTTSYARLQWVATFTSLRTRLFTVLIDASEIPQGNAVSAIYVNDILAGSRLLDLIKVSADPDEIEVNSGQFYQSFLRRLLKDKSTRAKHLDELYGAPRAPKNLRETEFAGGKIKLNDTLRILYEPNGEGLLEMFEKFAQGAVKNLIWAISVEGDLLIAEEHDGRGHPSITGFKPARIAGEIRRSSAAGTLYVNAESGRYSRDHINRLDLLDNAITRFERYFPGQQFEKQVVEYPIAPVSAA